MLVLPNDVENALSGAAPRAIASLSVVKAPYAGTVRHIRWLGQSPDGSLTAEITVMVDKIARL
ncbi:hypothetical protein IQ238_19480 [Pleurocapsales cyanobacterium LEGE 06147]|nr:hypothetical protein [Pleurocapsales cyanobacterium LEGE 06147]